MPYDTEEFEALSSWPARIAITVSVLLTTVAFCYPLALALWHSLE